MARGVGRFLNAPSSKPPAYQFILSSFGIPVVVVVVFVVFVVIISPSWVA